MLRARSDNSGAELARTDRPTAGALSQLERRLPSVVKNLVAGPD